MADNRYKVYRATNHTLGEIYVGITRDVALRCAQHAGDCSGGAKTVEHWNWDAHYVTVYTYPERFNSRSLASLYAHDIERYCLLPDGYDMFLTCGL